MEEYWQNLRDLCPIKITNIDFQSTNILGTWKCLNLEKTLKYDNLSILMDWIYLQM